MKRQYFIGWLWVALLCAGCSGSDEDGGVELEVPTVEEQEFPSSKHREVRIEEVIVSDAQPVTSVMTYSYDDEGRLVLYRHEQTVSAGGETFVFGDEASVSYADMQATVSDDSGNSWVYTLGRGGYAVGCLWTAPSGATREYTMGYEECTDGRMRLKQMTEWMEGRPFSSCSLDYREGGTVYVSQTVEECVQGFTLTDMSAVGTANRSEVYLPFLSELYPLSLHSVALYGKLLGEPSGYLIETVVPDANVGTEEEVRYAYTLDMDGQVTAIQQQTRHREAGGAWESYTRTLLFGFKAR